MLPRCAPTGSRERPTRPPAAYLLATLRTATFSEGAEKVVDLINKGVAPQSIWDGLFLRAGELLMQQPGIGGLHCVTSMNALHFAYCASGNDETRRMMMLQGASFLPLFKNFMSRSKLDETRKIDRLEKAETKATGAEAIEEVFAAAAWGQDEGRQQGSGADCGLETMGWRDS